MRTAFFGTPQIAVPALDALHQTTQVVGVVCQPDKPSGRGLKLTACPVKQRALELGLEVHQPVEVRTGTLHQWLSERATDLAVVIAYGRILPRLVLDAPRLGCVNLHASLLPLYRGAAPIQWAIMNGETETGISLMRIDEGLDTGPVFAMRKVPIEPEMTAGELSACLAELAASVVREDLAMVARGARPVPQDPARATHAPPIGPEHCRIDFTRAPASVVDQVRGLTPRPGAVTTLDGKRLRVLRASVVHGPEPTPSDAGHVLRCDGDQIWVRCGSGLLRIECAQVEGKKALSARDLVNGRTLRAGQLLGS